MSINAGKNSLSFSEKEFNNIKQSTINDLRQLIKISTVNPPGNETKAAEYIADRLSSCGFDTEILEGIKGRGNIITRLKVKNNNPPLLLLSHLDTVPADEPDWIVYPFSGEIIDNKIYGRGALDCKYSSAVWMNLIILLKKYNIPVNRDIIFLATSDEEDGKNSGIKWMIDNHPDKINAQFCLNEGGGFGFTIGNKTFYAYETAEKGLLWIKLIARGKGGHGSIPSNDLAINKLNEAINKWINYKFSIRLHPVTQELIKKLVEFNNIPFSHNIFNKLLEIFNNLDITSGIINNMPFIPVADLLGDYVNEFKAMISTSLTPTWLKSGNSFNVVPDIAEAGWDMRYLPGEDIDKVINDLKSMLPDNVSIELGNHYKSTESPIDTTMVKSIERAIRSVNSDLIPIPFLSPGYTDGYFLRQKGIHTYGFSPVHPADRDFNIHGVNENIPVRSIDFGLKLVFELINDFCIS